MIIAGGGGEWETRIRPKKRTPVLGGKRFQPEGITLSGEGLTTNIPTGGSQRSAKKNTGLCWNH